jgi:predicted nucleotidyltransferase
MSSHVAIDQKQLDELCARWKIERLELFGSVIRDDFGPDSDVDVLVTFAPDATWSLFDFVRCKADMQALFGRPVDLLTRPAVERSRNRFRRDAILGSAEVLHGA